MLVSCDLICETVNKEWNEKLVLSQAGSSEKKCTQEKEQKNKSGLFCHKTKIKRERLECLGRVTDINSAIKRTQLMFFSRRLGAN